MTESVLNSYAQSQREKLAQMEQAVWEEIASVLIPDFHLYFQTVIKDVDTLVNMTFRPPPVAMPVPGNKPVMLEAPVLQFERTIGMRRTDLHVLDEVYKELTRRYERNNPGCVMIVRTKEVKHG